MSRPSQNQLIPDLSVQRFYVLFIVFIYSMTENIFEILLLIQIVRLNRDKGSLENKTKSLIGSAMLACSSAVF